MSSGSQILNHPGVRSQTLGVQPVPRRIERRRPRRRAGAGPEGWALLTADVVAAASAFAVDPVMGMVAVPALAVLTASTGLCRGRFTLGLLDQMGALLLVCCALTVILTAASGVTGAGVATAGAASVVAFATAVTFRALVHSALRRRRRAGRLLRPVLLLGADAAALAERIAAHPETGLQVALTSCDGDVVFDAGGRRVRLFDAITSLDIREAVVGWQTAAELRSTVRDLARHGVRMHAVLPSLGAAPRRGWDDEIWGIPLLRLRGAPAAMPSASVKRLLDILVSGLALVALAPVLLVIASLVRREVGPGVIFRQDRVGRDGRVFEVLKFRSMRDLPDGKPSPWTVCGSDRIGPVGRTLRQYSLDELPQLWNVLRGDMSLVGPRPERPEYVQEFSRSVPDYQARHRAHVGLTGLAAVRGLRGDTSIVERALFDNLYVDSWSVWADLKIMVRTVSTVVRGTGS